MSSHASAEGAFSQAATPCRIQQIPHDQRLIPRKGMKIVAEAKPPIQC